MKGWCQLISLAAVWRAKPRLCVGAWLWVTFLFIPINLLVAEKRYEEFFSPGGRLELRDDKLQFSTLWAASVGSSGRIAAIEWDMEGEGFQKGKIFSSSDGRLLGTLDTPPPDLTKPGPDVIKEHLESVVEGKNGWFFGTSGRRLLAYDNRGVLQKKFDIAKYEVKKESERKTTVQKVQGPDLKRVDLSPDGSIVGAGVGYPVRNFLHRYDLNGKLLGEFFQMDSQLIIIGTDIYGLDVDTTGDIWCTVLTHYGVFRYGKDGSRKKGIVGKTSLFTPAPPRTEKGRRGWLRWIKSWTPVLDCAVTRSGYVLLVMLAGEKGKPYVKSYNPERKYDGGFFIDVYDREGNMMAGGLHTPHRFLCIDDKDNLWFALAPETPENPAKDGLVILAKYRLKLKPIAAKNNVSKPGR